MKKHILIYLFRYTCLVCVFTVGLMTIVGSNGGGGSDGSDLGFQWDTNPHTPTNLVATAVTSIKINISWTASRNAAEYVIYRNGRYITHVNKSHPTAVTDTPLNPDSRYCYTVEARNLLGRSPKSNQACATTFPDTPPTTPTNHVATAVTSTQIDLSWDAAMDDYGVTGYNIYRDGTYLKSVTGPSGSDSGLNPLANYCYAVSAYDVVGNESAQSNQACATTLPDIPPTRPTNLVATAVNPAQIDLSWDAATDDYGVTGYNIYRDGTYLKSVTGPSGSDSGLNPLANYCYAVSAYDVVGNESAQSIQVCEATPPDLTPPNAPGNLALISIPPDQIDLQWDPSSDDGVVTGYNIFRNGIYLKSVSATSASDIGVDKETLLCYEISAYDAAGNESAPSNQSCGMAWSITAIEDSHGGFYPSIAVDSTDKVHISYYDSTNGDLKYATNVSGAWVTDTIDSQGYVGRFSSIALNSIDTVHISYHKDSTIDLKYATNVSGAWVTDTIDSYWYVGSHTSIALDSTDNVHISYYDGGKGDLKYATNVSGVWVTDTIDGQNYVVVGFHNSIALDSIDNVHISYYDGSKGVLKYATKVSGAWVTDTIDSQDQVGRDTAIAIDSADNVHISYYDYTNEDLKYATYVSGAWVTDTIDSQDQVGRDTAIAIDSADNVHISYYDSTNEDLKYATNVSGAWDSYIIRGEGQGSTSIAVDSSDKIHISFDSYCHPSSCIKYAINR